MILPVLAKLGDSIETEVTQPMLGRIRMRLETPEACALGNELLMDERSGWRLVDVSRIEERVGVV